MYENLSGRGFVEDSSEGKEKARLQVCCDVCQQGTGRSVVGALGLVIGAPVAPCSRKGMESERHGAGRWRGVSEAWGFSTDGP